MTRKATVIKSKARNGLRFKRSDEKRDMKKKLDVPGRPKRTIQDEIHENNYQSVREINQIIGFLVGQFEIQDEFFQNFNGIEIKSFSIFESQEFQSKSLSLTERLRYGNKWTLPYFFHYFKENEERKDWKPVEVLDLILYWLHSQQLVPQSFLRETQKWKVNQKFTDEFFSKKQCKDNSLINLMILLVLNLGCLEDVDFKQDEEDVDFVKEIETGINNATWKLFEQIIK